MSHDLSLPSYPPPALPAQFDDLAIVSGNDLAGHLSSLTVSETSHSQQDFSLSLPDEILLRIFSLFPVGDPTTFTSLLAISRVSKRFMKVARDPAIWKPHLLYDYYYELQHPHLFRTVDYGDQYFQIYWNLKLGGYRTELALREIVLAPSKRTALLDKLCLIGGNHSYVALEPLTTVTPERDPQHWLSTRYWAKVAIEMTRRQGALREWGNRMWFGEATGYFPGWECSSLAAFSAYTGGDPRKVVEQFAALNLSILPDFMPTDDMSSKVVLKQFWNAFRNAGFERRAVTVESLLLEHVLAKTVPATTQTLTGNSPACSTVLFVELLRRLTTVSDVAILNADEYLVAVTFRDEGQEMLFVRVYTGEVLTWEEVTSLYPKFGLERWDRRMSFVPFWGRTTQQTLIEATGSQIGQLLQLKYPDIHFDDMSLHWSALNPIELGSWVLAQHLRLIQLIFFREDLRTNHIPTHSLFERQMLIRVFKELGDLVREGEEVDEKETGEILYFRSEEPTEEAYDKKFPDHIENGCCYDCGPPKDLVSYHHGDKKDWFGIGYSFLDDDYEDGNVLVVVGFEWIGAEEEGSKGLSIPPDKDYTSYLCLQLIPNRRGRFESCITFSNHRDIRKCERAPLSTLLDPSFEVGQFFRTYDEETGLLVPNAWLERMLDRMDSAKSAYKKWEEWANQQDDEMRAEEWFENEYDYSGDEVDEEVDRWRRAEIKSLKGNLKGRNGGESGGSGIRGGRGASTCKGRGGGGGRGGRGGKGSKPKAKARGEKTWN